MLIVGSKTILCVLLLKEQTEGFPWVLVGACGQKDHHYLCSSYVSQAVAEQRSKLFNGTQSIPTTHQEDSSCVLALKAFSFISKLFSEISHLLCGLAHNVGQTFVIPSCETTTVWRHHDYSSIVFICLKLGALPTDVLFCTCRSNRQR